MAEVQETLGSGRGGGGGGRGRGVPASRTFSQAIVKYIFFVSLELQISFTGSLYHSMHSSSIQSSP